MSFGGIPAVGTMPKQRAWASMDARTLATENSSLRALLASTQEKLTAAIEREKLNRVRLLATKRELQVTLLRQNRNLKDLMDQLELYSCHRVGSTEAEDEDVACGKAADSRRKVEFEDHSSQSSIVLIREARSVRAKKPRENMRRASKEPTFVSRVPVKEPAEDHSKIRAPKAHRADMKAWIMDLIRNIRSELKQQMTYVERFDRELSIAAKKVGSRARCVANIPPATDEGPSKELLADARLLLLSKRPSEHVNDIMPNDSLSNMKGSDDSSMKFELADAEEPTFASLCDIKPTDSYSNFGDTTDDFSFCADIELEPNDVMPTDSYSNFGDSD